MDRIVHNSKCAIIVLALAIPAAVATQEQLSDIRGFRKHVGETMRLCGPVVTYDYPGKDGSGDCALRLDIGGPFWNPVFYVLIKPEPGVVPTADPYLTHEVCATGKVESDHKHVPFVAVNGLGDLEAPNAASAAPVVTGAVQTCETGVVPAKLTKEVTAQYPFDQLGHVSKEDVLLQAVVNETGQVSACRTIYARRRAFGEAAEIAVRLWRFRPASRNGKPISVTVQVHMTFSL